MSLFADWDQYRLYKIAAHCTEQMEFQRGSIIINCDEITNKIYILLSGEADVFASAQSPSPLNALSRYDYFGESGNLTPPSYHITPYQHPYHTSSHHINTPMTSPLHPIKPIRNPILTLTLTLTNPTLSHRLQSTYLLSGFLNTNINTKQSIGRFAETFCVIAKSRVQVMVFQESEYHLIDGITALKILDLYNVRKTWREQRMRDVNHEKKVFRELKKSVFVDVTKPVITISSTAG